MLRHSLAILAVASLVGCQVGAEIDPNRLRAGDPTVTERTQLAAYAAATEYPRDAETQDDLRAAAVINRQDGTIKIMNFSDRALRDAIVWVNGSFVNRVDVIPANGSVTISRGHFYDATGRSLAAQATTANRVQIQLGDDLYNLQGPIYE